MKNFKIGLPILDLHVCVVVIYMCSINYYIVIDNDKMIQDFTDNHGLHLKVTEMIL